MTRLSYPPTQIIDQVDDYHGTPVADPYRWLEDLDSTQTQAWIEEQNQITFAYLEKIPARKRLRERLSELWDYARRLPPVKRGVRYFQLRNSGLQNQDVLVTFDSLEGEARVLLDPNRLSEDGTVALTHWVVSQDGRLLAYATSASGSDWMVWRVRDVDSGEDLPDRIEWSKFSSAAWLPDNSGFFYGFYDVPDPGKVLEGINKNQQLYFHRLGEAQSQDRLIYRRPDQPDWGFEPKVTEDGRYLVLTVWQGTDVRNRLFINDLQNEGEFVELISELEAAYLYVENDGSVFYLRTDLEAPRGRLIAVDFHQPEKSHWKTIIPEREDVLEHVMLAGGKFVALYLHNAHHRILMFERDGQPCGEISLPTRGSLATPLGPGITGSRDDPELFYLFSSFVHPATVYRYDLQTGASQSVFIPEIRFDFSDYQTSQVFVNSKDGTRIPMFLIHKNGLIQDGSRPTLLYGYGGFNIPVTPSFAIGQLAWLELGGLLAVANLRGGGEYGEEWHQAGALQNKQNVFDDFIACAEWLISEGFTSTHKLAIQGRSNGGLLVGACMTQRPDLFGACLPAVGVMDMLRFHKFTIGWAWVSDFGSSDDPEGFKTLYAYSPLHNLRPGVCYPSTLVTTADHDDRVVPGHSFKFAATLQAAQGCDNPVLIRIQTKAGHGFGKPTTILIDEIADQWAFLVRVLGISA